MSCNPNSLLFLYMQHQSITTSIGKILTINFFSGIEFGLGHAQKYTRPFSSLKGLGGKGFFSTLSFFGQLLLLPPFQLDDFLVHSSLYLVHHLPF